MKRVIDFARKRAELSPNAIAFDEVETGRRLTFADFNRRADGCAEVLASLGVARGEPVAILCHNSATFFEILMGCAKAGAILVPLNWRQTPTELEPILADSGARVLFHDAACAPLAGQLAKDAPVRAVSYADYEGMLAKSPCRPCPETQWDCDRAWYLLYTSGTTGKSKAVIQTFTMALANYVNLQQSTAMVPGESTLNFLPLFHTAGINLHTLPIFLMGGTNYVLSKFDPDPTIRLIADGKLSLFFGVPAIYQALSLHPDFDRVDLSRVRHWGCGGAPLPESLIRQFHARGVGVCNGMGMTETGPTVFLVDPDHAVTKIGSVGKPQLLTEVRLVDADGRDVAPGDSGELLFRGANITPGYFNNPEATAKAIDADGWLHSGDVGRCDGDGYYYIVDRIKDMYISGGENVYPAEVENTLTNHPAILEAAVIGIADDKWGEVGHAVIRTRPGQTITPDAVRAHARQHLAAYKVPKLVTVVDDYPRTAAGKVQKHVLRNLVKGKEG